MNDGCRRYDRCLIRFPTGAEFGLFQIGYILSREDLGRHSLKKEKHSLFFMSSWDVIQIIQVK